MKEETIETSEKKRPANKGSSSSNNNKEDPPIAKKQKALFAGDECVKLQECLGKWVVAFDLVVVEDEVQGLEVEQVCLSKGCKINFSKSGRATMEKGDDEEDDCHMEGTLVPEGTKVLPSGTKVLQFTWSPPAGKKNPGYSDSWEEGDRIHATVESMDRWLERFPLSYSLFSDETNEEIETTKKAQKELPDGIILIVHWSEFGDFGTKELLYLCRPDKAKEADKVLDKYGAFKNACFNF